MRHQDLVAARKLVRSKAIRTAGMFYLEHEPAAYTAKSGRVYSIYGSPVCPRVSRSLRHLTPRSQAAPFYSLGAFQYEPEEAKAIYDRIPPGTNILLTHTPPLGVCDVTKRGKHAGCPGLAERLVRDDLQSCRLHVYGHIHEAHGAALVGQSEGNPFGRVSVNAALPSVPRPEIGRAHV